MTKNTSETRERDEQSGRFQSNINKEQVRMAVVAHADEPLTTSDVHEIVGGSRRTVFHYLQQLAEDGEVHVRKPSANYALWSRPRTKSKESDNDTENKDAKTDGGTTGIEAVHADEFQF